MKFYLLLFSLLNFSVLSEAQLKFIIEDFEGVPDGPLNIKNGDGLFTFGNTKASINSKMGFHSDGHINYLGDRSIMVYKDGSLDYGGWGKGMGINVDLNPDQDYLNFYIYVPTDVSKTASSIKIELQEDDNGDNVYEKELDDSWVYIQKIEPGSSNAGDKNTWKLISIPLNKFTDANQGGDGMFNISYEKGKLFCFIMSFVDSPEKKMPKQNPDDLKKLQPWYFDFICFSKGALPTGDAVFNTPVASKTDFCNLGAWSKEGKPGDFCDIAYGFQNNFNASKKLGIIHFFQPFSTDGGNMQNNYPSVERINKVIQEGYIPLITLEDHFAKISPTMKQPNLYSITEGHFDDFFADWAKQLKKVKGDVLLRILHEFNGDWYPWCIVNNDKNPKLLVTAFRRIHRIFQEQGATNVKFIWCPNSTSYPQESWNTIMQAYPGDEYVHYVALDIYNGAGKDPLPAWRSFRKEGIENYFVLTQQLPNKPLLICETASRERKAGENTEAQNKAEWIRQMSEALQSDMSKIRLLVWFNEKETFKVNSSDESKKSFLDYVWKDDYFKSGTEYIYPLLQKY
ncbi:MAG: glycoside hydrolase family 26 protein [Bacteroidia bacterium]